MSVQRRVNLSEQSHPLFILKSHPESLKGAETFLRNRDWQLETSSSLKEALAYILKTQPEFVMICMDHPHPKARLLPNLLRQALRTHVIMYIDNATAAAIAAMKDANTEYAVYPPVSGPAIERMVLRILYDLDKKQKQKDEANNRLANTDGAAIASSHEVIVSRKGAIGESNAVIIQRNMRGSDQNNDLARQALSSLLIEEEDSGSHAKGATLKKRSAPGRQPVDNAGRPDRPSNTQPSTHTPAPHRPSWQQPQAPIFQQIPEAATWKQEPSRPPWVRKDGRFTEESPIVRGTNRALQQTTQPGLKPGERVEPVGKATQVACIAVSSTKLRGYLVAAFGQNKSIGPKFINLVRERLVEFMRSRGEDFNAEDAIGLTLVEVEFENWAEAEADFLRKAVHEGKEIALAFFPELAQQPELSPSAEVDMVMMDINEIVSDQPVNFDLYLHLEANQKYILYTHQGQRVASSQKDRLLEKGVKNFHLKKDDSMEVKRYRVQNYLNEKIQSYYSGRADATAL